MEKDPLHFESKAESKDIVAVAKEAEVVVTQADEHPFFLAYCLSDPHPNGRDGVASGTPLKQSPGNRSDRGPRDVRVGSVAASATGRVKCR